MLDSRDYRERDQLVSLLTGSQGLQRGVFRKSRGGRAPRSAATQVLSFVRFSAYIGPHAELVSFQEIELIRSSYPLTSSFSAASAASVVAETLLVFCPVNEPAPRRFRLGVALLAGDMLAVWAAPFKRRPLDGGFRTSQMPSMWNIRQVVVGQRSESSCSAAQAATVGAHRSAAGRSPRLARYSRTKCRGNAPSSPRFLPSKRAGKCRLSRIPHGPGARQHQADRKTKSEPFPQSVEPTS